MITALLIIAITVAVYVFTRHIGFDREAAVTLSVIALTVSTYLITGMWDHPRNALGQ